MSTYTTEAMFGPHIKLSTHSLMMLVGYLLLMAVNLMIIGDIVFNYATPLSQSDNNKKYVIFTALITCSIINAIITYFIKDQKILLGYRRQSRRIFAPIIFTFMQLAITAASIAIVVITKPNISNVRRITSILSILFINVGSLLAFWSFSMSTCTYISSSRYPSELPQGYP